MFEKFENDLKSEGKSNDTIRKYKSIVKRFLESNEDVIKYAEKLKYKDEVSHFKSAILHFGIELENSTIQDISKIYKEKTRRRRNKNEQVQLVKVWRAINAIRKNKKIKLAFRLSFVSGLRIKELADLKKSDLRFIEKEKRIIINVRHGKGNKPRKILTILEDEYLYNGLKELIKDLGEIDQVFYSRSHLSHMAKKYGFENHNLRANCVKTIFDKNKGTKEEALENCRRYLGHSEGSKTCLYYFSRNINNTGTKFDI